MPKAAGWSWAAPVAGGLRFDPAILLAPLLALLLLVFVAPTLWFFYSSLGEAGGTAGEIADAISPWSARQPSEPSFCAPTGCR